MKIERYQTKPLEVEVVFFDGSLETAKQLKSWARDAGVGNVMAQADLNDETLAVVHVMVDGSPMKVEPGDYIVRQNDNFYPYSKSEFETYFEVKADGE